MAANQIPIFQAAPKLVGLDIENGDGTGVQDLFTAGTNGALIDNISVTSTDTAAAVIVLTINDGVADFVIGEVDISAGSGTDGTAASVNLLDAGKLPFLQSGGGLPIGPSGKLKLNVKSAVTATKKIAVVAYGGDY